MRRLLVILLIIGVVGGASWFGYQQFGGTRAAASPDYEVVSLTRGDITSIVSASGAVLPERKTNLTLQTGGTITKVSVQAGDRVSSGQVLVQLDTKDLELALRQAQIILREARFSRQQRDYFEDDLSEQIARFMSPTEIADLFDKSLQLSDFDHPFYWAAFTYTGL